MFQNSVMKESNILQLILLQCSKLTGATLFRNNTGTGWIGKTSRTSDKGIYIKEPRPLRAGLCNGSSDLIGWTRKTITPDMIGKDIAVFTAIEVKTKIGRTTKDQVNFINAVNKAGGIAGVAKNAEDAVGLLNK